jgi:hypothetical protein
MKGLGRDAIEYSSHDAYSEDKTDSMAGNRCTKKAQDTVQVCAGYI